MGLKRRELTPFGQQVWAKRKLYSDRQKYLSTTRTQVRILCPAVTMSSTPGYFVQELKTGKFFHTGDIVEVAEVPEDLEVPAREAGYLHEVEERESLPQPRKRPGEEEFWAADWGELQQRGAQLLSEELSLVEEDEGEITNERFLKALTLEVEAVTEEANQVGQWDEAQKAVEIEKEIEEHPAFLQTRMVGLAEVRKNMAEWRPSMAEEYMVPWSQNQRRLSRSTVSGWKNSGSRQPSQERTSTWYLRRLSSVERLAWVATSAEGSPAETSCRRKAASPPLRPELVALRCGC